MRTLGLPAGASGGVPFTVWQLPKTNWSLVEADYSNVSSGTLSNCEVILLVKPSLDFTVIREVRAPKTDADVPEGGSLIVVFIAEDTKKDSRPYGAQTDQAASTYRVPAIPPGGTFIVLDGPRCGSGYTWWLVSYGGMIGWTAESGGYSYWIQPL